MKTSREELKMADFWVTEAMNGFGMTVQVTEELCHRQSKFQKIDV